MVSIVDSILNDLKRKGKIVDKKHRDYTRITRHKDVRRKKTMTIKEFQRVSTRTLNKELSLKDQTAHMMLGAITECGELGDIFKKHLWTGFELDLEEVKNECVDVLFYISNLMSLYNIKLEDVLEGNVKKLRKRFPNGYNDLDCRLRADVKR